MIEHKYFDIWVARIDIKKNERNESYSNTFTLTTLLSLKKFRQKGTRKVHAISGRVKATESKINVEGKKYI